MSNTNTQQYDAAVKRITDAGGTWPTQDGQDDALARDGAV